MGWSFPMGGACSPPMRVDVLIPLAVARVEKFSKSSG
jgi:hypothetical protein